MPLLENDDDVATEFGVIINRQSGAVSRIFNPDFDWEFSGHHVGPDEFMLRIPKKDFGIGLQPNAMNLDHVRRIELMFGKK